MAEKARDRARGALLGLACGDAVGTTVEFESPGSFAPLDDMVGGGPFRLAPGEWTDDTSMALCLAESIVDTRGLDLADHHRRFILWRDEGHLSSNGTCFDIGGTVGAQLRRFESTGEAVDPRPDQGSAANGSLMRLAPVPIAWRADVGVAAERSGESSRSTHAARRPVDSCRLLGAMLAALIEGADATEVFAPSFWRWGDLDPEVAAIAAGSYRQKEPPAIRGTGFCIDALEAALWAVAGADDFRQAVLRAANLGDDADTTAAIAGQIAGARWGAASMPEPWLTTLVMTERITSLADALFDLEAPTPAARPWAFDELVHAWWVEPGQVLAGEYPGGPGSRHKLDVLLDAGVRTFVDLTTVDDPLAPYQADLLDLAKVRNLPSRYERCPIPDLGTIDVDGYASIVDLIRAEAAGGRPVYIHCWGGVGRTGTVVGCLLADGHVDTDEVVAALVQLRAGTRKADRPSPETPDQLCLLTAWRARGAGG